MAPPDPVEALAALGVEKTVRTPGSGPRPKPGDSLSVRCTLSGAHGDADDALRGVDPLTVVAGRGQLIAGLDAALLTMQSGERAVLRCPPRAAFGRRGVPRLGGAVAAGVDVVAEVELLGTEAAPVGEAISTAQRAELAEALKRDGNDAVAEKDHHRGILHYRRCLRVARRCEKAGSDACKHIVVPTQLNLALCHNHLQQWRKSEALCTAVLAASPPAMSAAKAHFRRGTARRHIGIDLKAAEEDFVQALRLAPADSAARCSLHEVREHTQRMRKKEDRVCQAMFQQ
eukprot:TRINITY_DN19633_c0_g1_i1.p1 TRINITY_DN19633_c0_g1~~TRINITY_DN19633_c0_g1_i1.p1  ORF type:complete len:287 (+),score=76.23 TRINITY_DN19633_c0_g1_i1:61-921(+)